MIVVFDRVQNPIDPTLKECNFHFSLFETHLSVFTLPLVLTVAFLRAPPMEPQLKRTRLKEGVQDPEMDVFDIADKELEDMLVGMEEDMVEKEEEELDELMRKTLMPFLKSKVKFYTDVQERRLKNKLDKLEATCRV